MVKKGRKIAGRQRICPIMTFRLRSGSRFPVRSDTKGATMTGKRKTPEDGDAVREDNKVKLPPSLPEYDEEEDGDIATPKRDRDDEEQRDL
jgi:hypothetical protein